MLPSRGGALHVHHDLRQVQQYIQSRIQTEDPYLLSVNASEMESYLEEVQHYAKQKQRQAQVRRSLPTSTPAAMTGSVPPQQSVHVVQPRPASDRSLQPSPTGATATVPARLPGVEWLLANHRMKLPMAMPAQSDPFATTAAPLPPMHSYLSAAARPRVLKKQKTM